MPQTLEIGADSIAFDDPDGKIVFDPTLEFHRFLVVSIVGGIEHHDATVTLSETQLVGLFNWLHRLPGLPALAEASRG